MKSFKKLFAVVATLAMCSTLVPTASFAAGFSDELQGAYEYAYGMGITTQGSIDSANMYGTLIRSHMAKMMVNYAKELGQTADTSVEVNFTDVADQSTELQGYIEEAAQMGLMGLNADGSVATKFNPDGVVTRAQFGTVLSRVLYGDANNGSEPYYKGHLDALKAAGIMTNISTPNANEVRGYVMLMMMRADGKTTPATCSTAENILACTLGTSACPAECKDTPVAENANGSLSVKLAASAGADVPYGIPSLEVATYKFTADEDVRIDSLVLERVGYSSVDTLTSTSLFINGGRVSKVTGKFNSDDQVTATITNGYTVKAGETVEIAVNVAIAGKTVSSNATYNASGVMLTATGYASPAGDQFAIKIDSVGSTAKDVNLGSVTSDTFKVLDKANVAIDYKNGSAVDAPKVGADASDLFEFVLTNNSNQDSTLKSITFKDGSGSIDEATALKNFKLVVDGETIATAKALNGKYLTFNVADGYQIDKSDKAIFTVQADVVDGANESIHFVLDNSMDLVVIGDTYDVPMTVVTPTTAPYYTLDTKVSAGKVAIAKVNTDAGDLIRNKDNIFLGAFTITNNADQSLNLVNLGLTIAGSNGILDNVKVKLGSTTASPIDLTQATNVWSETDLGKAIGSKLTVYVYADTADNTLVETGSLKMSITDLRIEETENDTKVEDVTPSTLSWSTLNGQGSNGTLTKVALSDKIVSEGTEDIEALQFKIKAGEAYGTKIKKITFGAVGLSGAAAKTVDGDTITSAILYNGTTEIPATVKTDSIVIDDDFTIAAGTTATLTLKVGVASNPEANKVYYILSGANIDAVDLSSNADDVTFSTNLIGRTITITSAGQMVDTFENTVANNKYAKDILAGDSKVVAEYSVYSKYEAINVASGIVYFGKAVEDSLLDVQLYYGSELVASNPTWTDAYTAVFSDIDFDTATAKKALTVKLVSRVIDDNAGTGVSTYIDKIVLDGLKGKDSGEDIDYASLDSSNDFNIVPVTLVPAITTVGTTKGYFTLTAANGSNTTLGGEEAVARFATLTFSIDGNNGGLTGLTLKDDTGNPLDSQAVVNNNDVTFTVSSDDLSNGGATEFTVSATVDGVINTPSYNVSLQGITYTTNVDGHTVASDVNFGAAKTILSK